MKLNPDSQQSGPGEQRSLFTDRIFVYNNVNGGPGIRPAGFDIPNIISD
jgi:hypothetical protein